MSTRSKKKKRAVAFSSRRGHGRALAFGVRLLVWAIAAGLSAVLVFGAVYGLRRLLFVRNPYFIIEELDVRAGGRLRASEVEAYLAGAGVQPGVSNLFALDLSEIRALVRAQDPWVRRVTVSRRLPDTLEVRVYERQPVAQLRRSGGRLVDEDGVILPERYDQDLQDLPVITGVRKVAALEEGTRVSDPVVEAALEFLHLIATEPYGNFFRVAMIQLDYPQRRLKVHLVGQGTFPRPGARLILPVEGLEEAMRRVELIVRERTQLGLDTSFIDATYEVNVPVRP